MVISCLQTFGVVTNDEMRRELNPESLSATWSQRMFMLLLPWRRALLISVMQYDFKFIGQWIK